MNAPLPPPSMHRLWNVEDLVRRVLYFVGIEECSAIYPEIYSKGHSVFIPFEHIEIRTGPSTRRLAPLCAMARQARLIETIASPLIWKNINLAAVQTLDALYPGAEREHCQPNCAGCNRFRLLSGHVRHLSLIPSMDNHLTNLAVHCVPGKALFDRLESLRLQLPFTSQDGVHDNTTWVMHFLRPDIKSLSLSFAATPEESFHDVGLVIHQILHTKPPSLISLNVECKDEIWYREDLWVQLFEGLRSLESIVLSDSANITGAQVVTSFGHLPNLKALCIPFIDSIIQEAEPSNLFSAIRKLIIARDSSIPMVTSLIKSISGPLEWLEVKLDTLKSEASLIWPHVHDFTSSVSAFKGSLYRMTVELKTCTALRSELEQATEVRWAPFRILKALTRMRVFIFAAFLGSELPFHFEDADMNDLVQGWPYLEHFTLLWGDYEDSDKLVLPKLTLNGLAPLAEFCPRLSSLEVTAVDATRCEFSLPIRRDQPNRQDILDIYIHRMFVPPARDSLLPLATYLVRLWSRPLFFPYKVDTGRPDLSFGAIVATAQALRCYTVPGGPADVQEAIFDMILRSTKADDSTLARDGTEDLDEEGKEI